MEEAEDPLHVREEEVFPVTREEKVFENELLLGKILKFAIYDHHKLSITTVNHCKLVQRLWLDRVTAGIPKNAPVMVHLDTCNRKGRVKIKKFIKTFAHSSPNRIPRFEFRFDSDKSDWWYVRQENLRLCVECLSKCGAGLVTLAINAVFHGQGRGEHKPLTHISFDFQAVRLPQLESVSVFESCEWTHLRGIADERIMFLLQWVLAGGVHLQNFHLTQQFLKSQSEKPREINIQGLKVPVTVTQASLVSWGDPQFWNDLFQDNFSRLTKLRVDVSKPDCRDVILKIAHRFHQQLLIFEVDCGHLRKCGTVPIVMEKQEVVSCENWKSEWKAGIQTYFPGLQQIDLLRLNYAMLLLLLEITRCTTVDTVVVQLAQSKMNTDSQEKAQLSQIISLRRAFPNITLLNVVIPFSEDIVALTHIFQEMPHLQELLIRLSYEAMEREEGEPKKVNMDNINGRLLGLDPREVIALNQQRNNWNSITPNCDKPALVNMQALKRLKLSVDNPYPFHDIIGNLDVAVQFGCLRMKNLQNLWLNRFKISPEIAQKWKNQGRILIEKDKIKAVHSLWPIRHKWESWCE